MAENEPKQPSSNYSIGRELGSINAKLDSILKGNQKVTFSMLAIIAATVGVKFIGSPPTIILLTYVALFCSIFLLAGVVEGWRKFHWTRQFVRISFVALIAYSTSVRLFVFESGLHVAPEWFAPGIDIGFIALSLALILSAWRNFGK